MPVFLEKRNFEYAYDLNVEVICIDFVSSIWIVDVTLVQFAIGSRNININIFVFGMEQAINAKIRYRCFQNLKIVLFAEQSKCFPVCFSSLRRKRRGSLVFEFEPMFKIIQFVHVFVVCEKNKIKQLQRVLV